MIPAETGLCFGGPPGIRSRHLPQHLGMPRFRVLVPDGDISEGFVPTYEYRRIIIGHYGRRRGDERFAFYVGEDLTDAAGIAMFVSHMGLTPANLAQPAGD